ncbi:hypothetical protein BN444_01026 [Xanthomonas translucens pv. translucens DSM 18974]|uniref:Uncharacterized protein n=1 Tax=Xanthomonas translucens pv. translucens DSM 18974 TaxID=1261556 RepID=A0A1C3TSB5_XANCT|nr:hypothetical protein BN444_01026 [Xanthomonas translucens pv. translucens DSM 18974]SCB06138.1 hypothetical protein BN444_01026 [Xanthomonas translucens pv. translucens DSM 18974]
MLLCSGYVAEPFGESGARPLAFRQAGFPPCDGLAVAARPAHSLITESSK